jgi:hypothetical protein
MHAEELKPCPFCGAKADYIDMWFGYETKPIYNVGCEESHVLDVCEKTKELAAKEWNRRPEDALAKSHNSKRMPCCPQCGTVSRLETVYYCPKCVVTFQA